MVSARVPFFVLFGLIFRSLGQEISGSSGVDGNGMERREDGLKGTGDGRPDEAVSSPMSERDLQLRDFVFPEIKLPEIKLPEIHVPPLEELNEIGAKLEVAIKSFEEAFVKEKENIEHTLYAVSSFISVQVDLLPDEIKSIIRGFDDFRNQHPTLFVIAVGTVGVITAQLMLPQVMLSILGALGFSPLGPVVGSWAAALQSTIYGPNTGGIFAILQSITMSAQRVWPITVFTSIVSLAIGIGLVALLAREEVRDLVKEWSVATPFPEIVAGGVAYGALEVWMVQLSDKMSDAGVPHVQWLDFAVQAVFQHLEDLQDARAVRAETLDQNMLYLNLYKSSVNFAMIVRNDKPRNVAINDAVYHQLLKPR
ncbi:hypothetical protein VNI00_016288 [Paramarasmius palmivorus]|uniref:Uncharacterized protein n=1 Tax=Paramarasmius palmivorus TaxID=297713 RepID=A0AAW0BGT9_9AGAR